MGDRKARRQAITALNTAALAVTFSVLGISLGGLFEHLPWWLIWYSNPRPHLAAISLFTGGWFVWRQHKFLSVLSLLALLLNLALLLPLFVPPAPAVTSGLTLTVAHLNIHYGRAAIAHLDSLNADILLLQEVTPSLSPALPKIFTAYEVVHSHPLTNTHGSALLKRKASSVNIASTEIIHLPATSDRPLISAQVEVGQHSVQLLSLHLIRPRSPQTDRYQKAELAAVAKWSQKVQQAETTEVLVMGDFNATPWANRFLHLLSAGNLKNSLRGYGLQNTWPTNLPLILGVPIDHAVHSKGLVTTARSVSPVAGTDHALLQLELAFASAS
ncbi:MAG: endonuclease/exonuclease/phosphatase family protein [Leptolyngbya sp. SIO4C5]|nr:endonuclease/exonuclease/phosphatase family protein [Leptolyngbya sp. SIO4C5]